MNEENKAVNPELEKLSSQDLSQLVRQELEKGKPDRETVLQALRILEKREGSTENDIDIENSWKEFQESSTKIKGKKASSRWLKKVAVAAVIVFVFLFIAPPVFGAENIVQLMGRWTQDIFMLFGTDDNVVPETTQAFETDHPGLQEIHDTVVAQGLTQQIVPMWVPEECVLEEIKVTVLPEGPKIHARLTSGHEHILIIYTPFDEAAVRGYHKDAADVVIRRISGIEHYFMPNDGHWNAVWAASGAECTIITTYDYETLYRIVHSVYMGK